MWRRIVAAADPKPLIRERALALGFDAIGFCRAELGAQARRRLADFLAAGQHGDMGWMASRANARSDPKRLWPEARSVIALGVSYAPADDPMAPLARPDRGTISVYARNRDYHDVAKGMLKHLAQFVVSRFGPEVKVFVDTAPVMEKPLAVSAEDAHAIAKVSAEAKMPVIVNYFANWEPSRHAAYDAAHSGEIGEVRKVVAHDGHKGPKEIGVGPEFLSWLTDPKLNGGGALYDFGCYGADFMTWVMNGERPLTVTAVTLQIKPDVYPKVDDEATIVLTYPKADAILQASWNWPFGRSDVEVYGKTGTVFTRGRDEIELRLAGDKEPKKVAAKPLVEPRNDPITYMRAVVFEGMKPEGPGSLEMNLVVAEILDAARESAKTGKTVKMGKGGR